MTEPALLDALQDATRRLIRTVDALTDDELDAPSVLPGWTRAHVVAHLALNADALAGVLRGARAGETVAMYASPGTRDADIDTLAVAPHSELRDRFLASCTLFLEAAERIPEGADTATFSRVPGAPTFPVLLVLPMRHREVEVHHADLGAAYTVADWPEPFLDTTFNEVVHDREDGPAMRLRTPDGDVLLGAGDGPVVTGSRADLTWWLLGRGEGVGLTGDPALPTLSPWR
jgi:maleylpyruvate isomerase